MSNDKRRISGEFQRIQYTKGKEWTMMSLLERTEKAFHRAMSRISEALSEEPSINFVLENVDSTEEGFGVNNSALQPPSDVIMSPEVGELPIYDGGRTYTSFRARILN